MSNNDSFAQRLKDRRLELRLSQSELGRRAGIASAQISRYETGLVVPRDDVTAKIASALNVNFDWLLSGAGQKSIDDSTFFAKVRGMGFEKDSLEKGQMTIHFSSDATTKLRKIAEHQKKDVYIVTMNILYDAIDREYSKLESDEF